MHGQFYRMDLDTQFPYRVYATQQDNTSISVPSASEHGAIPFGEYTFPGPAKAGSLRSNPMIRYRLHRCCRSSPGGHGASSIIITEHASCASSTSGRKSITDGRTVTSNIGSLGPSPSHSLPMIRIRFTHAETMFLPVG